MPQSLNLTMDSLILYVPVIFALYMLTKSLFDKIQKLPPSPFPTLPIIGHLYLLRKPLHQTLSKISSRYGPILLLQLGSRRVLLVSSPSAAEECLTKNDAVFANRPRMLSGKHLGYNFSILAWANYGDHWRNLRRICSVEILSSNPLKALGAIRADEVRLLIQTLFRKRGEAVDVSAALFELTMNVMMRMIAGKRYYGGQVEEGKRFREIVADTFLVGTETYVGDFLPWFKWVGTSGLEKRMIALQERRDKFMQELIEEHRSKTIGGQGLELGENKNKTMIEILLSLQQKEPEYYTDELVKGLMIVLLAAGSDSSSLTLVWALALLINNPQVLKKAQVEIDNCVGQDHLLDESDLPNLPYLNCIINETLRIYSTGGPLLAPHESSEDCIVGGYKIPRGTMLVVNLWAIQNDPNLWKEPAKFKPERFEGMEGSRDGFKLIPFGFGRRGCPGEGLAMRVIGLALGSLIQCFDWVNTEKVDMTEGTGFNLTKAKPLVTNCRPRPEMVNLLSHM